MWFAPCRATGNHLAAQNDEPERTFEQIKADGEADARAVLRENKRPVLRQRLTAKDLNLAEQFAGEPFPLKDRS